MQLTPPTFNYGLPTKPAAWQTMRCLAPLLTRPLLAEIVAEFIKAARRACPDSLRGLEGAELFQRISLAATDDDGAIGWANIALEYCCEAYAETEDEERAAYLRKRSEDLLQEASIRQRFADHPQFADHAPRYAAPEAA